MLVNICNSTATTDKPATRASVVYREDGTIFTDLWKVGEWWEFTDKDIISEVTEIRRTGYAETVKHPIWGVIQQMEPMSIAKLTSNPIPPIKESKYKVTVTAVFKPTGQILYDQKEVEVSGWALLESEVITKAKKKLGISGTSIEVTSVKVDRVPEAA